MPPNHFQPMSEHGMKYPMTHQATELVRPIDNKVDFLYPQKLLYLSIKKNIDCYFIQTIYMIIKKNVTFISLVMPSII